jgi:twinkle protein
MIFGKNEWMPQTQKEESCIGFPYMRDGGLVNIKFRDARKNFKMVKDAELDFLITCHQ